MSETRGTLFIVDDDQAMCDMLADGLVRRGFAVTTFTDPNQALDALVEAQPEALIADLRMGRMDGLELCQRSRGVLPELPVVVMTAFGNLDTAVEAIRAGAYDFITKPVDVELVAVAAERAVRLARLTRELTALRDRQPAPSVEGFVGDSAAMKRVYDLVDRLGDSEATVLVTGESGTGKELVAAALHRTGRRREGPFLAVNCAALPETLLESELFGHVRGAFTDARQNRSGLLVGASGGTLFLDEIGEVPLPMQAKLLRALQERRVRPVGSDHEVSFDARIVAATNRDLGALVEERRFREDLYFRLNVVEIHLPPLRSRGRDVLTLVQHFLTLAAEAEGRPVRKLSRDAAAKLLSYRWPGNVRELQNCVEHAVALARFDEITLEDLPERIRGYEPDHVLVAAADVSQLVPLEEVERRYILRVLDAAGGQRKVAAQILGVDRKTLYRKLEGYKEDGYG